MTSRNTKRGKKLLFPQQLKSGLYVITCKINNRHYVGESANVVARINAQRNLLWNSLHWSKDLQRDFLLYGENNFLFQRLIFGIGTNKQDRCKLETCILSTLCFESRYNIFVNWYKRSPEFNAFFGKQHSAEAREAQRQAKKGKPSTFLNKTQSNAVKQLISDHNKNGGTRKKSLYIDYVFYESILEASERTGLTRRIIRSRCHSCEPRFSNYFWSQDTKSLCT